jgi:hypothetical protein
MWAVLDLVARLICVGGFVLVGWYVWRIVSAPDIARGCVSCGSELSEFDLATCYRCLYPAVSHVR